MLCVLTNERPVLFEAGLILGFVIAVRLEGPTHVEDAFRKARKLLKFLAKTSSLAREFYDMLTSLLEAVNIRRSVRAKFGTTASQPVVERLVDSDFCQFLESKSRLSSQNSSETIPVEQREEHVSSEGDTFDNGSGGFDFQSDEWQLFESQVSGFLPFPTDSFNLFLDSF